MNENEFKKRQLELHNRLFKCDNNVVVKVTDNEIWQWNECLAQQFVSQSPSFALNIFKEWQKLVSETSIVETCPSERVLQIFITIIDPCLNYLKTQKPLEKIPLEILKEVCDRIMSTPMNGYKFLHIFMSKGYELQLLQWFAAQPDDLMLSVIIKFICIRVNYREQIICEELQTAYINTINASLKALNVWLKNRKQVLDFIGIILESQDLMFLQRIATQVTEFKVVLNDFKDRDLIDCACEFFTNVLDKLYDHGVTFDFSPVATSVVKQLDKKIHIKIKSVHKYAWELVLEWVKTPGRFNEFAKPLWRKCDLIEPSINVIRLFQKQFLDTTTISVFHCMSKCMFYSFLHGNSDIRDEILRSGVLSSILSILVNHVCDCPLFPALTLQVVERMVPRLNIVSDPQSCVLPILQRLESIDVRVYPQIVQRSKLLVDRYFFKKCLYD